ncbi:hypothetical protein G6F23_013596 [Rhizopus arrhizus]|nr:hypothetical protein G6F23_013596 [Rhizopus arrhizus]
MQLLDQYGKASNAKVNLGKTVLLSLSGVSHDTWISIARSSDLTWHDASVKTAVRYLGYPLYHTRHQLLSYLNELKLKIIRQCHFLKERHLSIKGSGLVANSLILSTLWHILRVTPVPNTWLSEVVIGLQILYRLGWSVLCNCTLDIHLSYRSCYILTATGR